MGNVSRELSNERRGEEDDGDNHYPSQPKKITAIKKSRKNNCHKAQPHPDDNEQL
jgi:hypothetical protein